MENSPIKEVGNQNKPIATYDIDNFENHSSNLNQELKDSNFWSLYENGKKLSPLRYSNGKTQEDVVKEVADLIKKGKKIIFIHGVCGTGKCLDKDTLIYCKPEDKDGFGYYKISNLVNKSGKIISLDNSGNFVQSNFKNVTKTEVKKLYKLKTRIGREIVASANHPFMTITQNGIEWKKLSDLSNSSFICIPCKLPIFNDRFLDENKVKVLAHLIAEGKLGDKAGSPKYYQDKNIGGDVRADYEEALIKLFPDGQIRNKSQMEVTMVFNNMNTTHGTTNKLRLFVREFGLDRGKSGDKFVPSEIFNLSLSQISLFLRILFACDGSIYIKKGIGRRQNQYIIEYCSISKRLIYDVSLLLAMFGIQHTITSHQFKNKKEYSWRISISNHEQVKRYINNIGFLGEKQKLAMQVLSSLKNHKYTNIDKVPRIIRNYLKKKGYDFNKLDRYLNFEKIEELRKQIGYKKIIKQRLVETPQVFKQSKIDFLRSHVRKVNSYIKDDVLSFICNDSIMWDKVERIEFVKEEECYDLEVKKSHNFIANGIIVHNSAIALNIARVLGRTNVVVPFKNLQKQYEEDYTFKKSLIKQDGKKMLISVITGRDNHDSVISPGVSCADPFLPDTIIITEKNRDKILDYYNRNPFIENKIIPEIKKLRRISIAPANPYWSPIWPADYELDQLNDAKKYYYRGVSGRKYIFYKRKGGCSYYDQFHSYINSDVIIFNSAKYIIEMAIGRKPETEVDIIDEADAFLDNFSRDDTLNLSRLGISLQNLNPDYEEARFGLDKIRDLINLEILNKKALGIDEREIYPLKEMFVGGILKILLKNDALQAEILLNDGYYANKALEIALRFDELLEDTYVTYHKHEQELYVNLVTTNVARQFAELCDKTKAMVLMSGTLHSQDVLKNVFGIKDFAVVEAETKMPGSIEVIRNGNEIDCNHNNLQKEGMRKAYLFALSKCLESVIKPVLVHVNAYEDLPMDKEIIENGINNITSREKLREIQGNDKLDEMVMKFKNKERDILFSTKASRGVDFPGEICNSIIYTKYPNPNVKEIFWRILKKTHPGYFWSFYKDKAQREFLQRLFRALRSDKDHVFVLSPDIRVLEAVEKLVNYRQVKGDRAITLLGSIKTNTDQRNYP